MHALHQDGDAGPQRRQDEKPVEHIERFGDGLTAGGSRDAGCDVQNQTDQKNRQHIAQPVLRAADPAGRREVELDEARPHVFRLQQIDLRRPLALGDEIYQIAMPRPVLTVPIDGCEIVTLAVVPADRAAIAVGVETDDISTHVRPRLSGGNSIYGFSRGTAPDTYAAAALP